MANGGFVATLLASALVTACASSSSPEDDVRLPIDSAGTILQASPDYRHLLSDLSATTTAADE